MRLFTGETEGYSRGGLDVVTAVNLFFKGVLLFPVFLLAGYIGVTMMKHMIFHGIPAMNRPTPEQIERLQEQDSEIGAPVVVEERVMPEKVEEVQAVVPASPVLQVSAVERHAAASREFWKQWRVYEDCREKVSVEFREQCERFHPGEPPTFTNY